MRDSLCRSRHVWRVAIRTAPTDLARFYVIVALKRQQGGPCGIARPPNGSSCAESAETRHGLDPMLTGPPAFVSLAALFLPSWNQDLTSQAPRILTGADQGKRALAALSVSANFAFAKVVILAAPIGIAAITVPSIYGRIEVAYAFALLLAGLPLSAPLHGISHRYLMGEQPIVADQTYALI